ncbi:MAG TPA: hypothetical protein VF528_04305 [Pyrinomonadaceae bacterium]|jgi:hypothetical protein
MEVSSLVFALVLFSAGVLLIFLISGDFKGKKVQVQRIPDAPQRSPHVAPRVSKGTRQTSTPPPRLNAVKPAPATAARVETADQFQGLNVALVRETFERFTR